MNRIALGMLAVILTTVAANAGTQVNLRHVFGDDGIGYDRYAQVLHNGFSVFYVDQGTTESGDLFVGYGKPVYKKERFSLYLEPSLSRTFESSIWRANLLVIPRVKLPAGLRTEASYILRHRFDVGPTVQFFDRIRIDRDIGKWSIGLGTQALHVQGKKWNPDPFVAVGRNIDYHNIEVRVQKPNEGWRTHVRLTFRF